MIQLLHVSKIYRPDTVALKDISLEIAQGEMVFLAGPSGAGKTTLLKLLFCGEEPSKGQILINGKDLSELDRRGVARLRQRMGLVFQEFRFLPHMTVLDNVALAALVRGAPKRANYIKAYQLLRELGLREKIDSKPLALSGGERQRVAIARAVMNDPMVVLADEPTGNLDGDLADETMRLFLKIREGGTTIVIATHDLKLTRRYGTRVLSLRLRSSVDERRELLSRRVVALYRGHRGGGPLVLFKDGVPLGVLLQRQRYLETTVHFDRRLGQKLSAETTYQEKVSRDLARKKEEFNGQRRILTGLQEEIRQDAEKKKQLLANLQQEKEGRVRALKDLEQAALRLQKMMDEMSRRSVGKPPERVAGNGLDLNRRRPNGRFVER